ncbi:MAG: glycosyltransferase family 2 protein [Acidobacteria bacterium]|nr:glycosyltransferase family 2 protein [Acidobacteriota bacterium]
MEESLSETRKILTRLTEKRVGRSVSLEAPYVSVIIPAYNIAQFISDTLTSALSQTYKDLEIIVVNDGSDDTEELEKQMTPFIDSVIYAKQENSGASKARNLGIGLSRGRIIAFLDGDDIWEPNYLQLQVDHLVSKELDMVYCDAKFFGENYSSGETYMETTPSHGAVTPVSLIDGSCNVITSGTILKREKLEEFGLFDPRSVSAQDFDLWFRLAKNDVKIGYQREVLLSYRVSSTSLSGNNVERAERNTRILHFINEKYELSPEEKKVWERQLAFSEAEVELERGKFDLIHGDYHAALLHLEEANKYYRKPKLTLIKWLLRVSPGLTVKLFKIFRPAEFSFITPDNMQK